ncbi:MAG: hypothetical protein COA84_12100 [Robiginitomaculum sp.]|nr:MAG: hypothetical protein COA84_12100 [Robiginitomaculum sp.]
MSDHEDGQAVPKNIPDINTIMQGIDWSEPKAKNPNASPVLELDIEKYLGDIDEFDMTEEQKIELLQTLWDIMGQFVAMGFDIETPDKNCGQERLDSSADSTIMIK